MRGKLKNYKIAVIEGDGIGREVVPEGIRVLEAAARRFDLSLSWQHFDWSCETYLKTGRMMPENGLEQLRPYDAIYLGAVGYPGVPDHVSLWGLLIPIRRAFKQYVNLRPIRLLRVSGVLFVTARQVKSTSASSGRTTRVNTPRSAAVSTATLTSKWRSRRPSSRGGAAIAL